MKLSWWWLLLFWSCVSPLKGLKVETPLAIESQRFVLRTHESSPPGDTKLIAAAVERATPGLARWGGLTEPVTVYVVKSHGDLETAVHRGGFDWLKAWGTYDDVIFQTPSTWTKDSMHVDQLVLHELTHCLLFQRSGTRENWYLKGIPLWFREGMAIVTAGQAGEYSSLEDSAKWLEQNPYLNAFRDGDELSETQAIAVYGIGLHAFRFLLRRYGGDPKVIDLMKAMQAGALFPDAFASVFGLPVEQFQKSFEDYLKQRVFKKEFDAPTR